MLTVRMACRWNNNLCTARLEVLEMRYNILSLEAAKFIAGVWLAVHSKLYVYTVFMGGCQAGFPELREGQITSEVLEVLSVLRH